MIGSRNQSETNSWLNVNGEMGGLTKSIDWSKTILGPVDNWPKSLLTTVSNLLRSKFPMILWWGEDLIQFYNDAYRGILGINGKHPLALGQKAAECWAENWARITPLILQVETTGEAIWEENQLRQIFRNGQVEEGYWTFSYSSVLDDTGKHGGILITCVETTELIKSQQEKEDSQQEIMALFKQSPVAIATLSSDEDLTFQTANLFYAELVGRKEKDLIGKPLLEALPELEGQGFDTLLKDVITSGQPFMAYEVPAEIRRGGKLETIFVNLTYQPRKSPQGLVSGILVVATDVTQQVTARKGIEESQNQFHNLIYSSPFAIGILKGPELIITIGNDAILKIWGKGRDIFGKAYFEALPELAEQGYKEVFNQVYTSGKAANFVETPVEILQEGKLTLKYYNFILYPQRDRYENVEGIGIIASEVTPLAEQNLKIKESEERFRNLADNSPLFVFIIDPGPAAPVSYWNKTWLQYTGQTIEQAGGNAWDKIIHPDDIEIVNSHYTPAFQNMQSYLIPAVRVKRYDGEYRWHSFKGNPRILSNGNFNGYIGVGFDIHDQKITEERLEHLVNNRTYELQQSNRELKRSNESLEEFAHAASHDLKEPIRKIEFFIDQLKFQLDPFLKEKEEKSFSRIQIATKRMNNLIDDLLRYSHVSQKPFEREEIDLSQKVHSVMEDLELAILQKRAVIKVGPLPKVKGHRRQLQQLFQNLISNSLKYSKADEIPEIIITAHISTEQGKKYNVITVADNGIGFEQQYQERIFQLFSRLHAKSEYGGTGIGLAIVKKVAENHDGFIRVESIPGHGSTFKVFLLVEGC